MTDALLLNVFLSYSRKNRRKVYNFYKKLNEEGWIKPWVDHEDLRTGATWKNEILNFIEKEAHAVLVFLSEAALEREGYFQGEIRIALDRAQQLPDDDIFILPIRLEDCEIPRKLSTYQCSDYYRDTKKEYKNILKALEIKAGKVGISTAPPPQKLLVKIFFDIEYKFIKDVEIKASEILFISLSDISRLNTRKKRRKTIGLLVEMTARTLRDMELELKNKFSDLHTELRYQTHSIYRPDRH